MKYIVLIAILLAMSNTINAQVQRITGSSKNQIQIKPTVLGEDEGFKPPFNDTVYYLLDTSKMPVKDRLWELYREENFFVYGINCYCYPNQSNAGFTRSARRLGTIITIAQLKKLKLITLSDLIRYVSLYGANRTGPKTFYFIEPKGDAYSMNEVRLLWYIKPVILY